jgi:hypothetical protein
MSERLTGPQLEELSDLVVSAFTLDELKILIQTELYIRLENIVDVQGGLIAIVFDLLQYLEAFGRVRDFIFAVVKARPGRQGIRQFAVKIDPTTFGWIALIDRLVAQARETLTYLDAGMARERLTERFG